jgi:hypothetical protein
MYMVLYATCWGFVVVALTTLLMYTPRRHFSRHFSCTSCRQTQPFTAPLQVPLRPKPTHAGSNRVPGALHLRTSRLSLRSQLKPSPTTMQPETASISPCVRVLSRSLLLSLLLSLALSCSLSLSRSLALSRARAYFLSFSLPPSPVCAGYALCVCDVK